MYRIVILSFAFVAASAVDMDAPKCGHILHPGLMRCCTKPPPKENRMDSDLKECFKMGRGPPTCEVELCLAKKKGFATDDKLDKTKLEEVLAKDFQDNPDLLEAITKNCVNGDLEMYGPQDFCDFIKLKNCMEMQMFTQCPDWSDKGDCQGAKELVEECAKIYS